MDPADDLPLMDDPLEEPGSDDRGGERGEGSGKQPAASLLSLRLRRRPAPHSAAQIAPVQAVQAEPAPSPEPAPRPEPAPPEMSVPEPDWAPTPEAEATPEPDLEPSWAPAPETAVQAEPEAEPAWAPAAEPPSGPSGPSRPEPAAADSVPADIVAYWSGLRAGRTFPSPTDLDSDTIVSRWPNSILLTCAAGDVTMRAAALFKPLGAGQQTSYPHGPQPIDFSPMVVEWILSLAQDTVRQARPLTEQELFQLPDGKQGYTACALPLSTDQRNVDHVLCYVRAES